ncbi:unnamed protein product [Phyllotreta striolata]|uniref:Adenosine deaminase domain-containing protein n=1 Tax=Phyllotreta striolata TaxID=444603 RepID=A0A9N9TLX2_PHYSR|nr:unnamed protein product [Phyllotreta striolata]
MNGTNSVVKINTKEFCQKFPKIELHAHLNGSLNEDILRQLGCSDTSIEKYQKLTNILNKTTRTLEECFDLFKVAHNATKTQENLYLAAQSVIRDFDKENTIYLELRTTPRSEEDMSKEEYIETVVRAIKDCKNVCSILVKLILSIDRSQDAQTARESLDVILKMKEKHPEIIKGLDLSGNPSVGNFDVNLFEKARRSGLKISIHCAEVKNDEEVKKILEFVPDRLGHCVFLHPKHNGSAENWNIYLEKKIPIECCLTSNITCGIIEKYEAHHIGELIESKLPFSICTDDKGVFRTTLSNEYEQVMKHFDVSPKRLYQFVCETVKQCFASDDEKRLLLVQLQDYYQRVLQEMC